MAKAKTPSGRRPQTAQPAIAGSAVAADAPTPKKRTSIPQFASQVRAEARKIVWPSRKETWITSVMVFIMVVVATIFFWIVDYGLAFLSRIILAIGAQ
ncbi:preprotein translocase subunit SecE [Brevundimonas lenta]|uniref:Protein translocase subunit SecE n=1 Tax=Brevundimonas lenta TaxID=424796 RepID=A0A7W6JG89_9CAUL|nr:preprotein translocase subunit SecE [Brevundimonas lenta]MBB4083563.1 preprotein translocase subunit SecE [Brevundimonas lenta]